MDYTFPVLAAALLVFQTADATVEGYKVYNYFKENEVASINCIVEKPFRLETPEMGVVRGETP